MSFSLSLGPFQVVLRRKDSVPKPLIDEDKVRNNSGGYDHVPEHPNHARLAEVSKVLGDVAARNAADAAAKMAAQKAAQVTRADEILHVLNDSDAVDLVELHTNQVKAEGRSMFGNGAISLGRDMLAESWLVNSDLYLYTEAEPHPREFHFQDESRVVIGVRSFWSNGLRQVHLSEVESIDPVKLRARLDDIARRAMTDGRIAKEDRYAI